ncbi:outer membrane protein [Escherichia coli]|nr:outer membrane protein [Escherichia coli]
MPNHDRFECQTAIDSDAILHLESLSPAVEPYSIDEMFIDLRGINHCISPEFFGHQLREQVKSWTGLTMGVGIAPTKTLAKSAQ